MSKENREGEPMRRPDIDDLIKAANLNPNMKKVGGKGLTKREWDVIKMVADGASYADIGRKLSVTSVAIRNTAEDAKRKILGGLPTEQRQAYYNNRGLSYSTWELQRNKIKKKNR